MRRVIFLSLLFLPCLVHCQNRFSGFRVLVLAETGDQHKAFVDTAKVWLNELASQTGFTVDYFENPDNINDSFLSQYQLIFQLNYPPYRWSDVSKKAFEKYVSEGRGGWIGLHHATLLGEFDGYAMWPWFWSFMGEIRFKDYIASFASAEVTIEDRSHPCFKDIPGKFLITKDEWYTYDRSPRPKVHVLASVDESTYKPASDSKMGDHPVIWTNPNYKGKNIYIFMGHHPNLFRNEVYTALLKNTIFWAAAK